MDHLQHELRRSFLAIAFLFIGLAVCPAQSAMQLDTCSVNDICETAIQLPTIETDSYDVCVEGGVLGALPESFSSICGMDTLPAISRRSLDSYASFVRTQGLFDSAC